MLGTRTTETRKVISLFDDALARVPADRMHRYAMSRKIEDLGDLSNAPSKPVVFVLSPLLTTTEALADNDEACFQFHVTDIENAPQHWQCRWTDQAGGRRYLNDDCVGRVPRNVVSEMARVVRELANGDTTPFSSPDGWQAWRVRALALEVARRADSQSATVPATPTETTP